MNSVRLTNWLRYFKEHPVDTPVRIEIQAKNGASMESTTGELKDIIECHLNDIAFCQKTVDRAVRDAYKNFYEDVYHEKLTQSEKPFVEPPKWKYDYISFDPTMDYMMVNQFNRMGNEGWELVYCDFDKKFALFKRLK